MGGRSVHHRIIVRHIVVAAVPDYVTYNASMVADAPDSCDVTLTQEHRLLHLVVAVVGHVIGYSSYHKVHSAIGH